MKNNTFIFISIVVLISGCIENQSVIQSINVTTSNNTQKYLIEDNTSVVNITINTTETINIDKIRLNLITDLKKPYEYPQNSCERIAKDVQSIYGGSLIFIQPLKPNGAYDLCDYCGHMINKIYRKEVGIFYIDYGNQWTFSNESEVIDFYGSLYPSGDVEIFDISEKHPPFSLIYHY